MVFWLFRSINSTFEILVGTFLFYFLIIIFILRNYESYLPPPWVALPSTGVETTKRLHMSQQCAQKCFLTLLCKHGALEHVQCIFYSFTSCNVVSCPVANNSTLSVLSIDCTNICNNTTYCCILTKHQNQHSQIKSSRLDGRSGCMFGFFGWFFL